MSRFEELHQYTSQHPLTELRAKFRHDYESSVNTVIVIKKMLRKLQGYLIDFSNNSNINLQQIQIYEIYNKMIFKNLPVYNFKLFIDLIFSDVSDRRIWTQLTGLSDDHTHKKPLSLPDITFPIKSELTNNI